MVGIADSGAVIVLPSISDQTIWLPVSDVSPDGSIIDPTTGGVQVAYTNGSDPTGGWVVGGWEPGPIAISDGTTYYLVRVSIGSTGLAMPKGFYFLWIKLLFTSPNPVVRHSSIYIY